MRKVIFLFCLFSLSAVAKDLNHSKQLGSNLGNLIKGKYGSKSNLQQNLQSPMFGQGEMKTVDGSKSFNAQLECPSTKEFLTISVLPSSTGDIRILVRQDTDFDGKFDYSIDSNSYGFKTADGSSAGLISGVCANGVIVCKPGTWDSCTFWRWITSNGKLAFEEIPDIKAGLGGCYCINSSCGNIVWSAIDNILSSLGGGAVGAINESNTRVVISRSDLDTQNLTVSYYGQDSKNCKVINGEAEDVEKYSTGLIPADEYKVKQESDPNSPYYSLINSPAIKNVSVYTCEIRKVPQLRTETKSFFGEGKKGIGTDHYIYIRIVDDGSGVIHFQWVGTSPGGVKGWNNCNPSDWTDIDTFDWTKYKSFSKPTYYYFYMSAGCAGSGSVYFASDGSDNSLSSGGRLSEACDDGGCQYPTASWKWQVDLAVDVIYIQETGNCEPSSNCRLKEEQICDLEDNCVYTVKNFVSTGINLLPQKVVETSSTTGYTWTIYADGSSFTAVNQNGEQITVKTEEDSWFKIKRVYECEEDNQYEFDPKRTQTVLESANPDTGDYQDTLGKGHIPLNNLKIEYEDCPIACMVKITKNAGTVYSDETTKNDTTYQREVRLCEKDENGNYHCPISSGEEIEQDCGCVDGFGLAATTLQAINEASKDIICSSSPP